MNKQIKTFRKISYIIVLVIIMSISGHAAMLRDNNGNGHPFTKAIFGQSTQGFMSMMSINTSNNNSRHNREEGDVVGTSKPTVTNANDENWDVLYYYCQDEDCFSTDNVKTMGDDYITVMRGNFKKYTFGRFFTGNIKIDQIEDKNVEYQGDDLTWLGPRLTLSDPENVFKKYEVRFYSEDNPYRNNGMLQINYVDRTDWFDGDSLTNFTPSQILKQVPCDLKVNETYFVAVSKTLFGNLKVTVMDFDDVTCEVKWSNGMIESDEFELGVQSAGKHVISSFSELVSY